MHKNWIRVLPDYRCPPFYIDANKVLGVSEYGQHACEVHVEGGDSFRDMEHSTEQMIAVVEEARRVEVKP